MTHDADQGVHGPPLGAGDTPQNRLAAEVRRLTAFLVGRPLDAASLAWAADELAQVTSALDAAAGPGKRPREKPDAGAHPQDYFPASPMFGYLNPIAPPVEVWAVAGADGRRELRGRVTFGCAYEGPPTCVHGGVVAELFDEMLGAVNITAGRAGMTGTLTIKYRRPTPLMVPLDLVARQVSIDGRKLYAWGGIYANAELTAEADGIFIEMRPEKMLDIVAGNVAGVGPEVVDPGLAAFVAQGGRLLGAEGTLRPAGPDPRLPPEPP